MRKITGIAKYFCPFIYGDSFTKIRGIFQEGKRGHFLTLEYNYFGYNFRSINIILTIGTRFTGDSVLNGRLPRSDDAPLCVDSGDPLFCIPSILLVLVNQASEGRMARCRAPEKISSSGKCCRLSIFDPWNSSPGVRRRA